MVLLFGSTQCADQSKGLKHVAERLLLSLRRQSSSLLFHIAFSVCCSQLPDVMAGLGLSLQVSFLVCLWEECV